MTKYAVARAGLRALSRSGGYTGSALAAARFAATHRGTIWKGAKAAWNGSRAVRKWYSGPNGDKRKSTKAQKKPRKKRKIKETKTDKVPDQNIAAPTSHGFHYSFKKSKAKVSSKWGWKYIQQGTGNYLVTCTEGKQNILTVPGILTVPQMITAAATVGGAGQVLANDAYFDCLPWDLNPYKFNTGSTLFSGGANTAYGFYEDKIYLEKVSGFLDLLNTSTVSAAYCDVYWLVAKQTLSTSVATTLNSCITHDSFAGAANKGQAVYVGRSVATNANTVVSGYPDIEVYGLKPQQLPTFSKFYKIVQKDNLVLAPGESRRTYATFHYNENQLKADWLALTDGQANAVSKKNRTVFPVVFFRGAAVLGYDDSTSITTGQLTYASVQLAANFEWTYHWHAVKKLQDSVSFTRINPYFLSDTNAGATEMDMDQDEKARSNPLTAGRTSATTATTVTSIANM